MTNPFKDALASLPQARRKRGRGTTGSADPSFGSFLSSSSSAADPLTLEGQNVLFGWVRSFVREGGFEGLVKSLKNEFRRESGRLESGDRIVFFQVVGFCLRFYRGVKEEEEEEEGREEGEEGGKEEEGREGGRKGLGLEWVQALVQSMDVLSFHLVLSTIDTLIAERGFDSLVPAVALYKEMIHMLSTLAASPEPVHRHIALGLQVSPPSLPPSLPSFHLVLSTIDTLIAERGFDSLVPAVALPPSLPPSLVPAVALYTKMIYMLSTLAASPESVHRHIALGLQVSPPSLPPSLPPLYWYVDC